MGWPKRFDECKEKVIRMHKEGKSMRQTAFECGVCVRTIGVWYATLGLKRNFDPVSLRCGRIAHRDRMLVVNEAAKESNHNKTKHNCDLDNYRDDETEFIIAIDKWKTKHRRMPAYSEVLEI